MIFHHATNISLLITLSSVLAGELKKFYCSLKCVKEIPGKQYTIAVNIKILKIIELEFKKKL